MHDAKVEGKKQIVHTHSKTMYTTHALYTHVLGITATCNTLWAVITELGCPDQLDFSTSKKHRSFPKQWSHSGTGLA